ncbi:hypothetical protein SBA2_300014 [Acidobacteriia bacterium SbA2]|nr:hypothetical protein SBA2_300014 [Acidobacteriia bacterium SbA2]
MAGAPPLTLTENRVDRLRGDSHMRRQFIATEPTMTPLEAANRARLSTATVSSRALNDTDLGLRPDCI